LKVRSPTCGAAFTITNEPMTYEFSPPGQFGGGLTIVMPSPVDSVPHCTP
jgi:hypothetical protein